MNNIKDKVLRCLVEAHNEQWSAGSNVSPQTIKSSTVTELWQSKLIEKYGTRYLKKEYPALPDKPRQYRIDVVDLKNKIAYELKVSPKNPHHEFYKDIFKVALANANGTEIVKLWFCVEESAKSQLGLLGEFAQIEVKKLGFDVEVFYFKSNQSKTIDT